jgi:cyclase
MTPPTAAIRRSEQYDFEALADGVYAGVARDEGLALSNSGLVNLENGVLVFDTSSTLRAARDFEAVGAELAGGPPTLAANSHWHFDHVLGNQVYSQVPIYATRRTREILTQDPQRVLEGLRPDALERDAAELDRRARETGSARHREECELFARLNRGMAAESKELRLTPPNSAFDGRIRIPGDRTAELLTFGSGHTEGDAVLFLPGERVLFAGDLVVVDHHPNLAGGDPEHWLSVLAELDRLGAERVVPGHGRIASRNAIDWMRDYLSSILPLAETQGSASLPGRFSDLKWPGQFDENLSFLRARFRSRSERTEQ